ncbi:sulfite exporter TauE/SafE family protein [Piscinibacter sp. XHJ-5]|uniref:sulfite exporter TauE/SafE family protein n=1 Tax=Piscinibacter sp. XHJ-5 TaxID=3037797 RepID=UPI002452C20F|nr:sulfite exporter TauE/SafE family protein [Piscinibacter sp. XHJ-5]
MIDPIAAPLTPTMPTFEITPLIATIAFVFLLAGFVKGVVGLGLPTITMGLLSLAMSPAQAAALLVVPSLVTNVWQIAARPGLLSLMRRLATMLGGVCIGVALGGGWLTRGPSGAATAGLGIALLAYAGLGLLTLHWHIAPRHERWAAPLVGIATGLVTAATGVFVIPAVPYLQALGLDKEELVQALGLSFLVSTIALALALGHGGALPASAWTGSLLALLPALAGMGLGQKMRQRLQPALFKKLFLAALLTLGVYLAWRGLGA